MCLGLHKEEMTIMAHYAFLDDNNIVTEVITGVDENIIQTDLDGTQVGGTAEAWETFYGNLRGQVCKQTSYNTIEGVHRNGGTPFRKNFAGIGYTYDAARDAFIAPKPYNSWVLNEDTCCWEAPVPYPDTGFAHKWSEDELTWKEVE